MISANRIESWLTERVSGEQAEMTFAPTHGQLDSAPQMPNKPFAFDNHRWEALKSCTIEGDELWYFCSPPEPWAALCGRACIALVRDGRLVETVILRMN